MELKTVDIQEGEVDLGRTRKIDEYDQMHCRSS